MMVTMILLMELILHLRQAYVMTVDGSKGLVTLKITISKGGGTSSWTDRDPAESLGMMM